MSTEDKRRSPESAWLLNITTDSRHAIAQRLDTTHTKINRQLNGTTPLTADLVLDIAHAYKADPIRALLQAGKLTPSDMRPYSAANNALAALTNKALLQELLRRESVEGD